MRRRHRTSYSPLWGLHAGMPDAESRVLPTLVLALVRPDEAVIVSYHVFYNAGPLLSGRSPFANGPLTQIESGDVLDLGRTIFVVMRDVWGWRPRDLLDVRSFLYAHDRRSAPP